MRIVLIPSSPSPTFRSFSFPFLLFGGVFNSSTFLSLCSLFFSSQDSEPLFSPDMMSFYKKSVNSLLGYSASIDDTKPSSSNSPWKTHHSHGLGLINSSKNLQRPPNILESSSVKPPPTRENPRVIGFVEGGVDGLTSCTESIGFESSDERPMDGPPENLNGGNSKSFMSLRNSRERAMSKKTSESKKFPPPLSCLNHSGHPNFYLQAVRKEGRLELMEVKIDRPEILRASREDGRLILHLVRENSEEEEEEKEQEEEEEEEKEQEQEAVVAGDKVVAGEWKFSVPLPARCNEVVKHRHRNHHHHHLQHCLISR